MTVKKITFDESAGEFVLSSFDKTVDRDGFIVEKDNPDQKVLTSEGEPLKIGQFAGIKKGSEVYIKSDLISLLRLADEIQNE